MKTSCVIYPPLNQTLTIQAWQLEACNGDICTAAVLSVIERHQNEKSGIDKYHKHQNNIEELHRKPRSQNEDILIPIKLLDVRKSILNLSAEKKISESLKQLMVKGFISIHNNPDPEKVMDRTKYIRFYPEIVNKWIQTNYSNNGTLINQASGQVSDSAKKEIRYCEKSASILSKDSFDSAERKNRNDQKQMLNKPNEIQEENHHQVVEKCDNAKKEDRLSENTESNLPKRSLYNNINQSTSINFNQEESKNFNQHEISCNENSVNEVVNTLIQLGLSANKFNYSDIRPEIKRLQQSGATINTFIDAYEISINATSGRHFGMRYLIKAVEGLLKKSRKRINAQNHRLENKTSDKRLNNHQKTICESNVKNAEKWASDLI